MSQKYESNPHTERTAGVFFHSAQELRPNRVCFSCMSVHLIKQPDGFMLLQCKGRPVGWKPGECVYFGPELLDGKSKMFRTETETELNRIWAKRDSLRDSSRRLQTLTSVCAHGARYCPWKLFLSFKSRLIIFLSCRVIPSRLTEASAFTWTAAARWSRIAQIQRVRPSIPTGNGKWSTHW